MSRRSERNAFTLLELLLALSIAAVLAVSLLSSLHIAFKARRSAEASLRPTQRAEVALAMVCNDLEAALPPRGIFAGSFSGSRWADDRGQSGDSVAFCAAASGPTRSEPGSGIGDLKKVEFTTTVLRGTGEHALVRRTRGNLLEPVVTDPDEEILCRGVTAFAVRYFDGVLWQNEWTNLGSQKDVLPAAIEVTLELEPRDASDAARPLRFTRVVAMSCVGKVESAGSGGTDAPAGAPEGPGNPASPQQGPPGGGI